MASKMKDQGGMMDQAGMMRKDDRKELMTHLQSHVRTIIETCNQMAHVPASAHTWVEQKLPEGLYQSADEVVMRLGM